MKGAFALGRGLPCEFAHVIEVLDLLPLCMEFPRTLPVLIHRYKPYSVVHRIRSQYQFVPRLNITQLILVTSISIINSFQEKQLDI